MSYTVFLVNIDNPDAKSLMMKLHKEGKPGHFVRCTEAEIKAYCTEDGLIPVVIQERERDVPPMWAASAGLPNVVDGITELPSGKLERLCPRVTITHYTRYEGDSWWEWPATGMSVEGMPSKSAITIHELRLSDGREWDTVNGWRE